MNRYDLILIGTGQATGTILPKLIDMKLKIAVIEGDRVGGTCVNWGALRQKLWWPVPGRHLWPVAAKISE
jgi:pyruvate/2-oxoglutarate dehydrogenase complex dihydrolipoamide dehydrogenase (E3) component